MADRGHADLLRFTIPQECGQPDRGPRGPRDPGSRHDRTLAGRDHKRPRTQVGHGRSALQDFARTRVDLGTGQAHRLAERFGELEQQLVHGDGTGQSTAEGAQDLVGCFPRSVDEPGGGLEEACPHGDEDEGGHPGGHHGEGQDLLVTRRLRRMAETEHDDEVDGRDDDHEPEHCEDLHQAPAGVRSHPPVLAGQQTERHEHGCSRRDRTERSRPTDQEMEHRRPQRHRGRQGHPDPEPFHPLPLVPDRSDVAAAHRGDRQEPGNRPADRAVGQGEGPLVQDEHEPDGDRGHVAGQRHRPTDGVVQPAIGQGEEEVERDGGHHEGGERRDIARTARRVHHLRPAAGRQRHGRHQGVDGGQQMEGGRRAPGAVPGAGVDQPHERPGEGEAECHGVGRRRPSRDRRPPADHDGRHGEPEEEDLEQSERSEGG